MTSTYPENVLACIREHGPLTKTEIAHRVYGCKTPSERLEKILAELKTAKRVTLTAGRAKSSGQRSWVYQVPQ